MLSAILRDCANAIGWDSITTAGGGGGLWPLIALLFACIAGVCGIKLARANADFMAAFAQAHIARSL